jgi:hypothetical protein
MSNMPSIKNKELLRQVPAYLIFEKDSEGNYTPDAKLYQDILAYALKERLNESFTYHELAEWLLNSKNDEYKEYYAGNRAKTTTWNKIQGTRRRIEKFVHNLVESEYMAIVEYRKSPKNDIPMPVYGYRGLGLILSLIIEYGKTKEDPRKKEKLCNLLFEKIVSYFKSSNTYIGDFLVDLYKKIFDKGHKRTLANHLFEVLEQSSSGAVPHLLLASNWDEYLHLERDLVIKLELSEIFIQTLNELSDDARRAVMLHDKHFLEREILENMPPKEWSNLWVENIADPSKLTVYAKCGNCEGKYPTTVDYLRYLRESGEKGLMRSDCKICRAENTAAHYHYHGVLKDL